MKVIINPLSAVRHRTEKVMTRPIQHPFLCKLSTTLVFLKWNDIATNHCIENFGLEILLHSAPHLCKAHWRQVLDLQKPLVKLLTLGSSLASLSAV